MNENSIQNGSWWQSENRRRRNGGKERKEKSERKSVVCEKIGAKFTSTYGAAMDGEVSRVNSFFAAAAIAIPFPLGFRYALLLCICQW